MQDSTELLRIAIVGLGPRGLLVLERLLALSGQLSDKKIQIVVFEPKQPGVGVHDVDQPDYLLLNTIAFQLSMFPDQLANGSTIERPGPDFYQWCLARNIRLKQRGQSATTEDKLVKPTDFLPRSLLGQYLTWFFRHITAVLPQNVTLSINRERADSVQPLSGGRFLIRGDKGSQAEVDRMFLAIGHVGRIDAPETMRHIHQVYPLPQSTAVIPAGAVVGIEGFGLTTMDTLAALSSGRGGKYHRGADGRTRYTPSGQEPSIVLFSRSGLPFRVRPDTDVARKRHQPLFLNQANIARLRSRRPKGQLHFAQDVLPLLIQEMRAAFYLTHIQRDPKAARLSVQFADELAHASRESSVDDLFQQLSLQYGPFDPLEHLPTAVPPEAMADYQAWVKRFIEEDLREGGLGLAVSPLKSALEVWRDLRDVLRALIDFNGLDEVSHHHFYSHWTPLINRTVAGPQKERHQDLLALFDAGIVTISPPASAHWHAAEQCYYLSEGGNVKLDWLIRSRLTSSGILGTDSTLLADLYRAGLVRPRLNQEGLDGVEIIRHGTPLSRDGGEVDNLWLFGPLVEGSTYYNHYVPSAGAYSRAFTDAQGAVTECLGMHQKSVKPREVSA